MTIPSGKGRNGDLSIAIILLKSGITFLTSFLGVYHRAAIKAGSRHCSPNVRKRHKNDQSSFFIIPRSAVNGKWLDGSGVCYERGKRGRATGPSSQGDDRSKR